MLAALAVLVFMPAPVGAASCNGASHQPILSAGSITPGSGIVGSTFSFQVTYRDNGDCPPTQVVLRIPGIGSYSMAGAGTNYEDGVAYTRSVTVTEAGTFGYSFYAASGSGAGAKSVTLSAVSPSTFRVAAPAPPPAPTQPSARPPTPAPTPAPPAPTPSTVTPGPTRAGSPGASPTGVSGAALPTGSPSADEAGTPSARPSRTARPSTAPSLDAAAVGGFNLLPPGGILPLVVWASISGAGLLLFLFLATRRRPIDRATAVASGIGYGPPPGGEEEPAPHGSRRRPPDEENMPRWLRPSVQAARQGRYTED